MRVRVWASALVAASLSLAPSPARAASAWPPPDDDHAQRATAPAPLSVPPPAPTVAGPPLPPVDDAPAGYHTERRYIVGLLAPGAVITVVGTLFLASGLSSSASRDEDLRQAKDHGGDALEEAVNKHQYDGLATAIGVGHLVVGLPLLTFGLLFPRHVYVANQVSIAFVPVVTSDRAGGTLVMRF